MKIDISIVIPVYNEEKNIPLLYTELAKVLSSLERACEVIMVDDGSKDASWEELVKVAHADPRVKLLRHGRNMGLTQAYQNGFDHASGDYILIFAADLENDASEIIRVVQKLDEGFDVVNTNRVGRWGSASRKVPSKAANFLIEKVTGVALKDNGSGLKGFRAFVVKNLKMYGEMHRYFAAFSSVYTNRITEIDVAYRERIYGKSAYGSLSRTFKVFLDLFSLKFLVLMSKKPYSLMPGRLFGSIGIGMFTGGLISTAILLVDKFAYGHDIGGRPLLTFSFLLIVLGAQFVMTGLLGELIMRVYFESGGRKVYTVKEEVNF